MRPANCEKPSAQGEGKRYMQTDSAGGRIAMNPLRDGGGQGGSEQEAAMPARDGGQGAGGDGDHTDDKDRPRYGGWGSGSHLPPTTTQTTTQAADADGSDAGSAVSRAEPVDNDPSDPDTDLDLDPVDAMLTKSQKGTYKRRILYTTLAILSSPCTALFSLVPESVTGLEGS